MLFSVNDAQMILFDGPNGKLVDEVLEPGLLATTMKGPTISVASTRVPTIFILTCVFFSITLKVDGRSVPLL